MTMRFHHVGIAVKSIEVALRAYRAIFPKISEPVLISSQKVRVCFIETGPDVFIELVEPAGEGSAIDVFLRKGLTYYHNGFLTDAFDDAARTLEEQSAKPLAVFYSEAFGGRRCQFFVNTAMHLVEIIEAP